jgi:hydroxyacylglutathione hydrolase
MKKLILQCEILTVLIFLQFHCAPSKDFTILRQATGPIKTNCYLLFDTESREAALFDVGGSIDSLLSVITEKHLTLKYIFATHCHMDHVEGVPLIRERFPHALLCYNEEDYHDFLISIDWGEKNFDPKVTAAMKRDSAMAKWFAYDMSIFGPPNVLIEDNQIYSLGNLKIKTILSPGHSRGSICYQAGNVVFTGDVLSHRSVGRTDLLNGSTEALVGSVRRLYSQFPNETTVYPGHRQPTDIGSEKKGNKKITVDTVYIK